MLSIAKKRPPAASLIRHTLAVLLFLIAAGCSGGGCSSGCSSCGGITPLADGFPINKRIENAGSARIMPHGLQFLQNNLGTLAQGILGSSTMGGVIQFQVPQLSQSLGPITANICPNGSNPNGNPQICTAEIDLGNAALQITTATPDDIHVTGTIPLRVQDIEVSVDLGVCTPTINISLDGDGTCPGSSSSSKDPVPLNVDISIHTDTNMAHTARYGYTQMTINSVINTSDVTNNLDSSLNICGLASCDVGCCILHACTCALAGIGDWSPVKNAIINSLVGTLTSTLQSTISDQLCQKATATDPCPTGTTADSSQICRFADNSCASILLGVDGNINIGNLLQSLSPGTQGSLDFVFAGGGQDINTNDPTMMLHWGDLDPVKGGATLGLFGGAEADPLSKCVPISNMALPTGIPIPDELLAATATPDTVPNWPATLAGPDVGIAVNERFANYALNSVYNAGTLCLGISTESIALLSSGTLGLLAPSAKTLGLQEETQQVAIVIRPSSPPTVVFGNGTDLMTDPVLNVGLKQVALDFYIFSLDRFIRFMTATFDLQVPVNLTVDAMSGLTPVINQIGVNNGVVTNSQLLKEMPNDLAMSLGSLIGSLVGQQLGGSLKAINLNSSLASLGLTLTIPPTVTGMGSPGLIKLSKGTDNYLGIFASFGIPGQGPTPPGMHTHVQLSRKQVDPEGLKFATLKPDNMPVIELVAENDLAVGTSPVEYQYKIDDGFWHPYQTSRFISVQDAWMRVQGRHVVHVRSRLVGQPDTVDSVPAQIEVVIDADPPRIALTQGKDGQVTVAVKDHVTADPMVRYRLDDKAWSNWTPASRLTTLPLVADATQLSVEAQDSEGNVGSSQVELVRGRFDGTAASACGCRTVGGDEAPRGHALFLLGMALSGALARLGRRGKRGAPSAPRPSPSPTPSPSPSASVVHRRAARRVTSCKAMTAVGLVLVAGSWAGCNCNSAPQNNGNGMPDGGGGSCPSCIELSPGLIGEYSSAAVAGTDIWVSGYSEADYDNGNSYGDLVVGKYDSAAMKVAWKQVDGVPSTPAVDCTMYDCNGFRGGQTASGDDVGVWSSIAVGGDGKPAVAYFDRTNQALKFAQYNGSTWTVQMVDSVTGGVAGRYAKMIALNGNFVIAYQTVAPGGMNGALISTVRVATSAGGTPATGTWTTEDAVTVNTTPCRAQFCASTEACLSTTKQCTTTLDPSMCNPSCASGTACVTSSGAPACVAAWDTSKIDAYPDAIGDYITLAPDGQGGFGLAYYDRTNGDLRIAAKASGTWTTTLVDGESAKSGDSGVGANLFIDGNGDWHLSYVNGYTEALQYVKVTKGTTVGMPEIVDNGLSIAGTNNTDGQHLVGDDSHIVVLASGEVHISYQDSTAGTLHYAVGAPGSTGHMWTVGAVTQNGFAGAFSSIVVANNQTQLMNWWRTGGNAGIAGDVRFVAPPM